jgi:hypothetical protein
MPIANIELIMMALATVLASQHFPRKVDNWEGLPSSSRMWAVWKMAFRLTHLKHQPQILASGGGASWSGSWCASRGGSNNRAAQEGTQQPSSHGHKQQGHPPAARGGQPGLHDHSHNAHSNQQEVGRHGGQGKRGGTLVVTLTTPERGVRATRNPFTGNYCWTHGHCCNKHHTSTTWDNKAVGHWDGATASNTMGGSTRDKGWDRACT